jgi:hypothetical protein
VYRAASPQERHSAHRALAEATDPGIDPDRRAWHRARAATGLDEDVAAELEGSATRAGARGGLAAAAAFWERAAELTPDRTHRARRALAAAQAKQQAGAPDAALRLLAIAEAGPLDELGHARAELLRARLAADPGRGGDAPQLLLKAASRLEPLHAGLAREAYRDAFRAVLEAGRLAVRGGLVEVAEAVRAAPQPPQPAGGKDLLLNGLAVLLTEGSAVGAPMLKRALTAFRDGVLTDDGFQWLPLACSMSRDIWDDESWYALSTRLIEHARQSGALAMLPAALLMGVPIRLLAGALATAASMTEEAEAVGEATANPVGPYGRMVLTAWTGREAEAGQVTATATREMVARGEGQWLTAAHWVTAVLHNGLCQYDEALVAAEQGSSQYPDELGLAALSMAELIEAAARIGQPERAASAMRHLSQATATAGSDWALGIQARSRALLSDGESAEYLYREAIERLSRTRVRVELARAHLVYGEWLRRQSRRVDARDQLRTAYEMLTAMGLDGFAERARRELLATGETVRKPVRSRARPVYPRRDRRGRRVGRPDHPAIRHPADRVTGVTYGSGALIAAERSERRMWARHRALLLRRIVPTVPAPVVAQCWRGTPRQAQLARFLAGCEVETLDDTRARATGTLAGRARIVDIVDANVLEGALRRGDLIITSDEGDLAAIAAAVSRHIDIDHP